MFSFAARREGVDSKSAPALTAIFTSLVVWVVGLAVLVTASYIIAP